MSNATLNGKKHRTLCRDARGNLMDAVTALKQLSDRIRILENVNPVDRAFMFSMVNSALLSVVDSQATIAEMMELIEKAPRRRKSADSSA